MKAVFSLASKAAPSIIFIDEVCMQAMKSIIFIHSPFVLCLMLAFSYFFYRLTVCLEREKVGESTKPCAR